MAFTDLKSFSLLFLLSVLVCCQSPKEQTADAEYVQEISANPPADGFDSENSDNEAIDIADQVMEAMGGRSAWDNTRYISWDFFGARKLVWDKYNGDVRIDFPDSSVYLVNTNTGSGKVLKQGEEVLHSDSLEKEIEKGRRIWINDSYWLVMPFKLKDSGVTLKYLGTEKIDSGTTSQVLELTFKGVGVTPQNKYLVYVDSITHLVNQWAFYRDVKQDSANFVSSWGGYEMHGQILLSDERGDRKLNDVMVYDSLPADVFNLFNSVDLSQYHESTL